MFIRQFIYTLLLLTNIEYIHAIDHNIFDLNLQSFQNDNSQQSVPAASHSNPDKYKTSVKWDGSIFFNEKTLSLLDKAILQISKISIGNIVVNKVQEDEIKKMTQTKFNLDTIIFHNDTEWVLWINNNKINAPKKNLTELKVKIIDIKPSYAIFQWHLDFSLDDLVPKWHDKLKFSNDGYINHDNTIKYDQFNNTIEFSLSVNQAFILKDLEIEEGNDNTIITLQENL